MLEIKNLTKIYKPKKGVPVKALDNVSLKLPDKGMVFILGKSGSGKSTLLNVLGGLDSFTEGEFIIKGEKAQGFKQMHYDSYRNTYIGFIFQEYNILKDFSVGANIALALELQGKHYDNEVIREILKKVDLEGYGDRKPNELSGGQLQRVAIARALVKNPDIIMADEPTGALDSKTGEAVFEILKKLSNDKLVLIVSHDREFSEKYADRIIELSDGKVISDVSIKGVDNNIEKSDTQNVSFEGERVIINDGFTLSDEEFLKIKEYIKNYHGPIDLNLNNFKDNKKSKNYIFDNTIDEDIQMDNSGFKLIKSKLSLKNSFKIGASGLKHKKGKLVFTILLSLIAFTFFGLADTAASYDLKRTTVASIMDTGIDYASFVKGKKREITEDDYSFVSSNLTKEDIEELSKRTGLNLKGVYNNNKFTSLGLDNFSNLVSSNDSFLGYSSFYTTSFYGTIEFNQEDLNKFGYKLIGDSVLPDGNKNEIMLTKYEALTFIGNKLITMDDDGRKISEIEIKDEKDLIGKYLYLGTTNYKITAIIDTNMDIDRFSPLKEEPGEGIDFNYYALLSELSSLRSSSLHSLLFVGEGFNDKKGISKPNTLAYLGNGSINILRDSNKEEPDYLDYTYLSSFSYYDLFTNDESDYYVIPKEGLVINKLGDNEIILSEQAIFKLVSNKFEDSEDIQNESSVEFNKSYNINGNDYKIFTFLGLGNDSTNSDLLRNLSPLQCGYSQVRASLELLSQDYDSWYEKALSSGAIGEDGNVQDLVNYIIASSKINEYLSVGTPISQKMHEINADTLCKLYQKYCNDNLKLIYQSYTYYSGERNESYDIKVVGVGYTNGFGSNYAVLSDKIWNIYFDINPYEVYSFCVGELKHSRDLVEKLIDITLDESEDVRYQLTNNVVDEVFGLKEALDLLGKIYLYIGIVFAIFACLLLSNFIATSISYKKEEIGILRAIGSRSNDVFRIFFSEAFIIAMINFVLSSLLTFFISIIVNKAVRSEVFLQISIFTFGIRQILLLFILCIASATISSFFPVYKNARKKPIDAIRNR